MVTGSPSLCQASRTRRVGSSYSLRVFAAVTVLAINMAMVSGPTPPGTGVMRPAFGRTRVKSTSPVNTAPRFSKAAIFFSLPG